MPSVILLLPVVLFRSLRPRVVDREIPAKAKFPVGLRPTHLRLAFPDASSRSAELIPAINVGVYFEFPGVSATPEVRRSAGRS